MGRPWQCCCGGKCPLGEDNFDRPDSDDPGPKWYEVYGDWKLLDKTVISPENGTEGGVLSTTICHPPMYKHGSWVASFTLVNCRRLEVFEVGGGHPLDFEYIDEPGDENEEDDDYGKYRPNGKIIYYPLDMDTLNARIKVVVESKEIEEFEYPWPLDPETGKSADRVLAFACFLPGAIMRGSIGIEPQVDACVCAIEEDDDVCYIIDGKGVGNFHFLKGRFDDWWAEVTVIDDLRCQPCGCFCMQVKDDKLDSFSCYPDALSLEFELVEGNCPVLDGKKMILRKSLQSSAFGDDDIYNWPEKYHWASEMESCTAGITTAINFGFMATCGISGTKEYGTYIDGALGLAFLVNNSVVSFSSVLFNWEPPLNTYKFPELDKSICSPLYMVYEYLVVRSFFGPCGFPGQFGYFPFCCWETSDNCTSEPPYVKFRLILTEAPEDEQDYETNCPAEYVERDHNE